MSYEVVFAPTARREMSAVPERVIPAIIEFVYGDLASNPRRVGKALERELAGSFSAGKAYADLVSSKASLKTAAASIGKGTRCARLFLVRSGGSSHPSGVISDRQAPAISPRR
mgnify:CR=1 FL=1